MAESEFKTRSNHDEHAEAAVVTVMTTPTATTAAEPLLSSAAGDSSVVDAIVAGAAAEEMHFFEGVEKLLEIWFEPGTNADLRKVPRSMWDALLKSVRCEIISFSRNDEVDAYVLSESSMFVSKRRWILKTCGSTTPLQCLQPLLLLAAQIAGHAAVQELFYSRKNFKRPELQQSPHRGFDEEVALLDTFFPDGRAYCLGSVNRDCWYIYTLSRGTGGQNAGGALQRSAAKTAAVPLLRTISGGSLDATRDGDGDRLCSSSNSSDVDEELELEEEDGELSCNSNDSGCGGFAVSSSVAGGGGIGGVQLQPPEPDQTIEILMTELDPAVMALFTKRECADAQAATQRSGIHKLLPGMVIDDYLFEPCGYSMNGVGKDNGCYMTIHITPEPTYSYVSFESNVSASNYGELIARVIETFQPNKFVVTVFANKTSAAFESARELDHAATIGPWLRQDIQFCRFASYDLTYAHYCKFPS